jgi:hypothetical protein
MACHKPSHIAGALPSQADTRLLSESLPTGPEQEDARSARRGTLLRHDGKVLCQEAKVFSSGIVVPKQGIG